MCHCHCRPSAGDIVIEAPHAIRTNVTRLRVRGKSPTVYEFNLTVTDQHNLTSWDTVLVTVTKGRLYCILLFIFGNEVSLLILQ